jgi:hypothetical protein
VTRTLYCARSSYALSVEVPLSYTVEPGVAGRIVDELHPGHPRRAEVVVAISAGAHERAERAYRGPVEAAVRQLTRMARSEVAA